MTSTHRSEEGDGSSKTLAQSIQKIATQKPPPPEGKGIVMVVLAVVVVIAALYQFLTGGGAGAVIRENHAHQPKASEGPSPADQVTKTRRVIKRIDGMMPDPQPGTPATAGRGREIEVIDPTERPVEMPIVLPGADMKVPDGIDARTAGALRLSLHALQPGPHSRKLVIDDALRHMATVIEGAPEASKAKARTFLLGQLARHVRRISIGGRVLDAALEVAGGEAGGLEPVVQAALSHALRADENAAAALVFFDGIPAQARGDANAAIAALVRDEVRPLHLRVLAIERLVAWDAVSDELRAWASQETRERSIRSALE